MKYQPDQLDKTAGSQITQDWYKITTKSEATINPVLILRISKISSFIDIYNYIDNNHKIWSKNCGTMLFSAFQYSHAPKIAQMPKNEGIDSFMKFLYCLKNKVLVDVVWPTNYTHEKT